MLEAVIANRRRGHREVTVLDRLLSVLFPRPTPPPVPPPPTVETSTPQERQRIDAKLRGAEAHLAELLAQAGLDELRTRHKERPGAE